MTGVGIVGLGFMGRTHLAAWQLAAEDGRDVRVAAVCDADPDRRAGRAAPGGNLDTGATEQLFDPAQVAGVERAAELFARPDVDVVSVCTPTDSHVDLAREALAAGKHVLVEKPLAVNAASVARLAEAARASDRVCLPAMCLRFWPGWQWLGETVRGGTLGAVRSAVFRRLSAPPAWGQAFYGDVARSGGALFDLHVHDVDMIAWCFGVPDAVASVGSYDHVTTQYRWAAGDGAAPRHVVAEGGWDHDPSFPFHMGFEVAFEGGTAQFALGREAPLTLARDGAAEPVELPEGTGYDGQVRHLLDVIEGRATPALSVDDALAVTRVVEAEAESLRTGEVVRVAR